MILKRPQSFIKLIAILSITGVVTITAFSLSQSNTMQDKKFYGYSICRQAQMTSVADDLGLDYEFVVSDRWGYPILNLFATQRDIEYFYQQYEFKYPDDSPTSFSDGYNIAAKENYDACSLENVKYHVADINDKLLPYIPNDAHHVSYDPKADRAVYCYYLDGELGGSQCYFIERVDNYLITDDISDIERANLVATNRFYSMRKQQNEFYSARSSVRDWTDNPNKMYGIEFMTSTYAYNRIPFWFEY